MNAILSALPAATATAINLSVRKLRVAGLQEGAREYECNVCGQNHRGVGIAKVRLVPVVVCQDCSCDSDLTDITAEQLAKWEGMIL